MKSNTQKIEMLHNRNQEERKYIALEDLNFAWLGEEILAVIMQWNDGKAIWDIAEQLKRPQEECAVLLIDLARKGILSERPGGVLGNLN